MEVSDLHHDERRTPGSVSVKPVVSVRSVIASDRKRRGCGSVTRMRAIRYTRKRRMPKSLWPILATLILVSLIFERRPIPLGRWPGRSTNDAATSTSPLRHLAEFRHSGAAAEPSDTGGAVRGEQEPHYRPPARLFAMDVSQVVAFLIRNRGRLDNDAVRAKWSILDRTSLPLAVYLRDIEAAAAWDDLDKEISVVPCAALAMPASDLPKSRRHQKILQLLPDWFRRGEELLLPELAGDPSPTPTPDIDGDNGPGTKPQKP